MSRLLPPRNMGRGLIKGCGLRTSRAVRSWIMPPDEGDAQIMGHCPLTCGLRCSWITATGQGGRADDGS